MRKKRIITTILVILSANLYAQFVWEKPIEIAPTAFGKTRPIVKLINDSVPIVIWSNISTKDVYFSKYENNEFSTPIQLNPSNLDVMIYDWSAPEMAVFGNHIFVVFRTNPWDNGHIYLVKSIDGGENWSDTIRVDQFDVNSKLGYFPSITATSDSNITVVFMHHAGDDINPQYTRVISSDGGATFSDTLDLSRKLGAEACDCCPPNIISTPDKQVFIFRNNDNNVREFKCLTSSDNGVTFDDTVSVDNGNWNVSFCPSSLASSVIIDNTLHTAYMSDAKVYITQSNLIDGNLLYRGIVSSTSGNKNYPKIASNGKQMVVIWEGVGNNTDLFINTFKSDLSDFMASNGKVLIDSIGSQVKPDITIYDSIIYIVYTDNQTNTVKFLKGKFGEIKDANTIYNNLQSDFLVYPNPATNYLKVNEKFDNISVYSIDGKIVLSTKKEKIDISNLTNGTYTVVLKRGELRFSTTLRKY